MLIRLLILFIVVPAIELALLLFLGDRIGPWWTLGIIFTTGFIGARLARSQGSRAWKRIREALAAGQVPGTELVDGLLILIAGALLVTPGVITDTAGFCLLIPPTRRLIRSHVVAYFKRRLHIQSFGTTVDPLTARPRPHRNDVIEVDAETVSEPTPDPTTAQRLS